MPASDSSGDSGPAELRIGQTLACCRYDACPSPALKLVKVAAVAIVGAARAALIPAWSYYIN